MWASIWAHMPPFSSCRTTTPRVNLYQRAGPTTTHIKFHKPCQASQFKSIHHTRNNCQHTPCYTSNMVQKTNLFILLSACSPHTHSAANLQISKPHIWAWMFMWLPLCNAYIIHGQKQWGALASSKPLSQSTEGQIQICCMDIIHRIGIRARVDGVSWEWQPFAMVTNHSNPKSTEFLRTVGQGPSDSESSQSHVDRHSPV